MKLQIYIQREIRDNKGRLISFKKQESNSLVRAFLDILYCQVTQGSLISVVDTSNIARTVVTYATDLALTGGAGNDVFGVLVGSGSTAVSVTDYKLATQILNGSTSGKLNHLTTTMTQPATIGTTHSFTIARGFTNVSGSPVSVSEVGLVAAGHVGAGDLWFLIDRTLMSFVIAHNATGTVTYTIQVSV